MSFVIIIVRIMVVLCSVNLSQLAWNNYWMKVWSPKYQIVRIFNKDIEPIGPDA